MAKSFPIVKTRGDTLERFIWSPVQNSNVTFAGAHTEEIGPTKSTWAKSMDCTKSPEEDYISNVAKLLQVVSVKLIPTWQSLRRVKELMSAAVKSSV